MIYQVTLNGRTREVRVDGDRVLLDGRPASAELRTVEGTPARVLLLDGASWTMTMESGSRGLWILQVHGERHEVEVLDERTAHIRSLVGVSAGKSGAGVLKAPMPGMVVRILAEPGQAVSAGQGLVVLEAMKMENELKAAAAGIVDRIEVAPGQAVEKGAPLIHFRAPS